MATRATTTTMPAARMEFAPASLSKSEAQPIGSYGLMGCFYICWWLCPPSLIEKGKEYGSFKK